VTPAGPGTDGRVSVHLEVGEETRTAPAETPSRGSPFPILVLGDFSGRAARGDAAGGRPRGTPLAERSPVPVDRDDLDRVLGELAPELRLELPGGEGHRIHARFRRLEDFHPDRLFRRLTAFDRLADLHRRLGDAGATGERPDDVDDAGDGGLLDRVVSASGGSSPGEGSGGSGTAGDGSGTPPADRDAFAEYVRELVRPHLVREQGPGPEERELRDRLETALGEGMAALLHHPRFQALESTWRGLDFLVRRVRTGPDLEIHLLDVTKGELRRDLDRDAGDGDGVLRRRVVEERAGTAGADPWALMVGLYAFGPDDVDLLGRLGALARAGGAPFLGAAAPSLAGVPSFARRPGREDWGPGGGEAWRRLRSSDVAPWLGLALPRLLLRLPYGPDDAPCEAFTFREMGSPPRHDDYLWGNPALACAALLARSFSEEGWEMRPGARREIDRLPLHVYRADGEARARPCAEMLMSESVARAFMERGFIPLASVKERGAARVVRFQSVADPPTALAGRWG
jgi:predicted component of type VI protein secretion system